MASSRKEGTRDRGGPSPALPRVVALFRAPEPGAPMRRLRKAMLVAGLGVEGDRRAKRGSARQVLLVAIEHVRALGVRPGDLRENVATRGIDLQSLPSGSRLRLGEAVVELTKPCGPCAKLNRVRDGLMRDSRGRRGVLARVIRGGTLRIGTAVGVE